MTPTQILNACLREHDPSATNRPCSNCVERALDKAVAKEREACANVADEEAAGLDRAGDEGERITVAKEIAAAIRERGR